MSTACGKDGWTAVTAAADSGQIDLVRQLHQLGVALSSRHLVGGCTALHYAAQNGFPDIVEFILNTGVNPDLEDTEDWTPLHYTCDQGHLEVAKILIDGSAGVNTRTIQGHTPVFLAAQSGHVEVLRFLLASGGDPSVREEEGWAPLQVITIS